MTPSFSIVVERVARSRTGRVGMMAGWAWLACTSSPADRPPARRVASSDVTTPSLARSSAG
jgi:hypothetical protein